MFCANCGSAVPENAKFCPECGKRLITATTKNKTIETVQFRCKGCGNVMEINPDSPVLRCPFCGSNELIQEDKDITVERIRSRSKREGQQTYKEVQKGWQAIRQKEIEEGSKRAEYARAKDEMHSYLSGDLYDLTIGILVISIIGLGIASLCKATITIIIAILQIILAFVSILMGLQTIKERGHGLRICLVILSAVLIVPYLSFCSSEFSRNSEKERLIAEQEEIEEAKSKKLIWPSSGLAQVLPKPETDNGEIDYNDDDRFGFSLYFISKEQYNAYVQNCIDIGFSVDSEWSGNSYYRAYNQEGYFLDADHYETFNPPEMSIRLDAPREMTEIVWPKTKIVKKLPKPESTIGSISTDTETHFVIYVGNTTREQFSQYVDACMSAGFDRDYNKSEDYFSADYKNDYHLRVDYEGYNTIEINLEKIE